MGTRKDALTPNETAAAFFRQLRTLEHNALIKHLFPEGVGWYEQEKVVARIRRHFPEVSRKELRGMNPGDLVVYLKAVVEAEVKRADAPGSKGKRKRSKGKPGPKGPQYDAKEDKRLFNGWKGSGEKTIEAFARKVERVTTPREILAIRRAIEREKKRRSRKGLK